MDVTLLQKFESIKDSLLDEEVTYDDEISVQSDEQKLIRKNNKCIHCNSFKIIMDVELGYNVCYECGRIIDEILDCGQEWRTPGNNDSRKFSDPSRVGLPINEHFQKASLSTIILGYGYEIYRRYQQYNSMDYSERKLLKNFQQIDSSVENKNIPESIREKAKNMFKKISEDSSKRGSCKNSNMAACIYFASQDKNMKQNKENLSKCFNIKKKKFTKGCNYYKEAIFDKEPNFYKKMNPINYDDEIDRFAEILNIEEDFINIIKYVAYLANELGIVLKNTPTSIAIGSIYLVSQIYKLKIGKKEISEKCSVSDVTINKAYSNMVNYYYLLMPTERLFNEFLEIKNEKLLAEKSADY